MKALILQSVYDIPTQFQYEMLIRNKPVSEGLSKGIIQMVYGPVLTREMAIKELLKPYSFVALLGHGDDLTFRGANREIVLTKNDDYLFKNKLVYAYVCRSYESGIYDKAKESITYQGKFIFPRPKINPAYNKGIDEWHVLELGFHPLNMAIRYILNGKKPNLLEIYKDTIKNYGLALKRVKSDDADFALRNNMARLRYRFNP
jgi:hypothetical protein